MKRRYFGTDGVRGPFGGPVVNEAFAARLGLAAGRWIGGAGMALIGADTRASGPLLVAALERGLVASGLEVRRLGVLPTPAVARAVRASDAVLGVVITASHNPAEDNGIKFFARGGIKLADEDEAAIEAHLPPEGRQVAAVSASPVVDAVTDYLTSVGRLLPAGALRGWNLVLDTANGATAGTSPVVLRALGAEVTGIGDRPDGYNINREIGSEHPEAMVAAVRARGARLGIAHDGDGDRCVVCDEQGTVLDGDEVLTILALHALRRGRLAGGQLVVTVQSNLGVDAALKAAGGRVVRTQVGDRYVLQRMIADGSSLGGESSGHVVCADVAPTGDGLVAALRLIEVMLETGQPLSVLRTALRKFPQGTRALKVAEKPPIETCPRLVATIAALEAEMGDGGRVLVRYSGTEPKLRLLIEAGDDLAVQRGLDRLEAAVRQDVKLG
ncbi:MAG: phosphoglucosamine mutase [Opitutaceae bacterium]|nr:phosphoglucosamine mutase [Opitutaceae bacterium]